MRPFLLAAIALGGLGIGIAAHVGGSLFYLVYSGIGDTGHQFADDFESGDLAGWDHMGAVQRCCGTSMVIDEEIVRSGEKALRVQLSSSDPDVKKRKRAELRLRSTPLDTAVTYAFSMHIPADWEADPIPVMLAQWHAVPDKLLLEKGRPPPLRITIIDDTLYVLSIWDTSRHSGLHGSFQPEGEAIVHQSPLDRGEWTDWSIDVQWALDDSGMIVVRKNGVEVGRRTGPTAYNDWLAPYLKLGIYAPHWTPALDREQSVTERTIYLDDIRVSPFSGDAPRTTD